MHFIVLGIFILKLQTSLSQYPDHMDFQKVGEVIFNNEKFNILKPTTHVISDYFKQFMLRTDDSDFPTKRVFIDDNGLRHFWTGFGKKTSSLRKTDDIDSRVIDNTETKIDSNQNDKHSNEVSENQDDNTENKDSIEKHTEEEDNVTPGSTTLKSLLAKKKRMFRSGSGIKKSLRNDKKDDKSKAESAKTDDPAKTDAPANTEAPAITDAPALEGNATTTVEKDKKDTKSEDTEKKKEKGSKSKRTVASTTFFCPFFGVITMSAFID